MTKFVQQAPIEIRAGKSGPGDLKGRAAADGRAGDSPAA
jgi:hypothetical protein